MPKKIDPKVKERCVRQVLEHLPEYPSLTAAAEVVARREGLGKVTQSVGEGAQWPGRLPRPGSGGNVGHVAFLGAFVGFGLLTFALWRSPADDMLGQVAAAGTACWFASQTFQNIGMCLGIMPVPGVPLPLVSYGGSSTFASMMALGLLQNIAMRGSMVSRAGRFTPLAR